ncbi:MAG: hypothetical protein ACYCYO_01840 [Bacilli bacterium]
MDLIRPVTADHVMFDECVAAFRPVDSNVKVTSDNLNGHLFLDFMLKQPIEASGIQIGPSREFRLSGPYSAFVSEVQIPSLAPHPHHPFMSHLAVIALGSIVSFILGRPVKAPRSNYEMPDTLPFQFPILIAGPGAHDTQIAQGNLEKIISELRSMIQLLLILPYPTYVEAMRSIRLVNLAHINKRDDFALAYYLLISAIEPIAVKAIKKESVARTYDLLPTWKSLSRGNKDLRKLFNEFKQLVGNNKYLSLRFAEFVMRYCGRDQWAQLDHPLQNTLAYSAQLRQENIDFSWVIEKRWWEVYPEQLNDDKIREILRQAYEHRSKFTHEGKSPPHQDPSAHTRFFQTITSINHDNNTGKAEYSEVIVPEFRFMSFIAKRSIMNYFTEIAQAENFQ